MIEFDTDNLQMELFYRNLNYNKYIKENHINIIFKFLCCNKDIETANHSHTVYIFCDLQDIRIKYRDLILYSNFDNCYNYLSFVVKNSIDSNNLKDYKFIKYFCEYYKDILKEIINLDYYDKNINDKI